MDSANSHVVAVKPLSRSVHTNKPLTSLFKKSVRRKCYAFTGAHEIFRPEMWKAALTELTATASLMFTLTTSIVSCLDSHGTDPKLLVPFAVFMIVFLFLLVTVPLSGGHMSPVFTFIGALKGVVTLTRALIYVLAQIIGSIIGFFILKCVIDPKLAYTYSLGGCAIDGQKVSFGIKPQNALLVEFACTFVVLFVGVTLAFDKKRSRALGLPMVCLVVAGATALAVFVSITVTGRAGYAGVGLNPARCLGPALLHGGPLWHGHWVFWLGPFLACMVYYLLSMNLPKEDLVWLEEEHDVFDTSFSKNLPEQCNAGFQLQV
ncbi:probable aquaporin TIP1-2 [Vigna unguiculata]|uniref:Aquaporin TIP n=1 Tax=Vigna unguiculata TaxID=3917 RepID=A0A4D6LKC9_VIGUN|nr:probable aquaporin TIP1-2 [Vigna unguiculata]QCD88795.1 aquaporin TIP [Vigna unguiculata]